MISAVERVSALPATLKVHRDHPKAGVNMIDTWAAMCDPLVLDALVAMAKAALPLVPGTVFLGMATRGCALAALLACALKGRYVPVTKKVNLPAALVASTPFESEYGAGVQQLPLALLPAPDGNTVWPAYVVDDLVATGGSVAAAQALLPPHVRAVGVIALIEFTDLPRATMLPVHAAFRYTHTGDYVGVGLLYHSWLPVVDLRPATTDAPVNFYAPALQYMRNDWGMWRPIPLERFPDGVLNGRFRADLEGVDVVVHLDMTDFGTREAQVEFCKILPAQGVRSLRVVVGFLPDGTMERVTTEGEIACAETTLNGLNGIPMTPTGPATIEIWDLHALASRFFVHATSARVVMRTYLEVVALDLVVFPDDGAAKRYGHLVGDRPVLVLAKVRDGDARKVIVHYTRNMARSAAETVAGARNIVLFDDLTRTGGTILEALRTLEGLGARRKSVYVDIANVSLADDSMFRLVGNAPACFNRVTVSDATYVGHALSRVNLPGFRVGVHATARGCVPGSVPPPSINPLRTVTGSLNPAKACGAEFAVCVPSGVLNQPNAALAEVGAKNRAVAAMEIASGCFNVGRAVGCESGLDAEWFDVSAVCVVRSPDPPAVVYGTKVRRTGASVVVPEAARTIAVPGPVTAGEVLARRWGTSGDGWIGMLGGDRAETFGALVRLL